MRSSAVSGGDAALASQYNNLRLDAQAASYLLAHEQSSPDMTLYVEAGTVNFNDTLVYYAGGNSPTVTAPVSNNRIDVLTIDSSGTLAWTTGTSGASPSAPAIPAGKCPIVYIYVRSTSTTLLDADGGSTTGYIQHDIRPFLRLLSKAAGSDVDTGTDDAKFLTAKAINDSHNVPMVAPSTSGNLMTSNGTDWVSSAPLGDSSFDAGSFMLTGDFSDVTNSQSLVGSGGPSANGSANLVSLNTTTTANNKVFVWSGSIGVMDWSKNHWGRYIVQRFTLTGTTTQSYFRLFFAANNNNGDPTKYFGFRVEGGTVAWYAVSKDGTTETVSSALSSMLADATNGTEVLDAIFTPSSIVFYRNGVSKATITTNIPASTNTANSNSCFNLYLQNGSNTVSGQLNVIRGVFKRTM